MEDFGRSMRMLLDLWAPNLHQGLAVKCSDATVVARAYAPFGYLIESALTIVILPML